MTLQNRVRRKRSYVGYSDLPTIIFLSLIVVPVFAQTTPVSGIVKSIPEGEPLQGVKVVIKGTPIGTETGLDGTFNMRANSNEDVLVFSAVGFLSEEVVVGNERYVDIALVPDITSLNEMIVIGSGEVKSDSTESVSSSKSTDIEKVPSVTFEQAPRRGLATLLSA